MGAEQSLIGGRKRNRSIVSTDITGSKRNNYEAYKAVRSMLEEQGKDFESQPFLDLPDIRVLKRLGIFEECDIGRFDDKDCKNSIKNIVINGHGRLIENDDDIHISLVVPDNIVVLFMGELGYVTWSSSYRNVPKEICHKELVPNQIGLPGSTIPNVRLSAEYQENNDYSTGIFDCELNDNDNVNQFEGFEHYLIPTDEAVTKSMKPKVKEMLEKATQKGKEIINKITLSEILPKISEKIPKDKYGFVYVFSCLGACKYDTKDEIELYTKPTGLSSVRGYTVKKIPARTNVARFSTGTGDAWNPVLTNNEDIIKYRNWFVDSYNDKDITDRKFIDSFDGMYAFKFGKEWRDHLPYLDSNFIQKNDSMLRRDAFVNHFKFIDLLHEGDLEKIKNAWNMQFKDKTKFLLPRTSYSIYTENLREEVKNLFYILTDNEEIFLNIEKFYKQIQNPDETIKNFIKKRDLEGLKEFIFLYMKQGVNGYENAKRFEYEILYNEDDKDNETVKKALKILEAHESYNYIVIFGDLAGEDDYYIENKDELKNALDIQPYIDYVNSDEYVHPEKEYVIVMMGKINRIFGFITEKEKKILELFKKDDIETAKVVMFDYMKQGANDVDFWYIYERLRDDNYPQNIQDIVYMHIMYYDFIKDGQESGIEDFITGLEPTYVEEEQIISYRKALDIKPYLDYIVSAEYVHIEKEYVIEKMNKLRDALGFTGVQQAGMRRQVVYGGQAGQYGGMWQRGGFFMTCS